MQAPSTPLAIPALAPALIPPGFVFCEEKVELGDILRAEVVGERVVVLANVLSVFEVMVVERSTVVIVAAVLGFLRVVEITIDADGATDMEVTLAVMVACEFGVVVKVGNKPPSTQYID
jgi:hypothetical protein